MQPQMAQMTQMNKQMKNYILFVNNTRLGLAIEPRNKQDYLHELRRLGKLEWRQFRCGMLFCEIHDGYFPSGHPRAMQTDLQVHHEKDLIRLRRKCIGSMRAWVVRNLKEDWVDPTVERSGFNTREVER
jgi:hypothetical protein